MLIDIKNLTAGQQEEPRAKQNLTVDDLLNISSHRISASADPNDVLRSIEARHAEQNLPTKSEIKEVAKQYDSALADLKAVEKTESAIATDDKGRQQHRENVKRVYDRVSTLRERLRKLLATAKDGGMKIEAISLSADDDGDNSGVNAVDAYDAAKLRVHFHLPLSGNDEIILGLYSDADFAAARAARNAQLSARGIEPDEKPDPQEVAWLRKQCGLPAA